MSNDRRASVGFVKELNLADAGPLLSSRSQSTVNTNGGAKTQSTIDGELVEDIVEKVIEHTFHNAQLLRYRLLQSVGVTLQPLEEASLLRGEETDAERKGTFQEEMAILRDAVMIHFYPQKRQQLMHMTSPSGGGSTMSGLTGASSFRPGASARNDVGPNAQLLRLPRASSLSDVIREQVDTLFQATYEETALRLAAHQSDVEERIGPNRRLNKAIALQRDRLHKSESETARLRASVSDLEKQVSTQAVAAERREALHKQQLNGYLREVAILKEQLYRTYRDKSYVGKNVDLMPAIVDEDACEDVNVDQLLHYRRTMRNVDQQIAVYQMKIKSLEEDIEGREQAMHAFQEKQRSRELAVANAQKELDDMNSMVVGLEQEREDLQLQVKGLKAELHRVLTNVPPTASTQVQATEEEDDAMQQSYRHVETSVVLRESKPDAMRSFDSLVSERVALNQQLAEMDAKAREERRVLEAANKELERRATYAEKRQDDLRKISTDAIARQTVAETHAAEVIAASTSQATTLSSELKVAQDEVVALRAQNATLCLAYTNMWERLQAIKTKGGLNDYKQRSNAHHSERAEAAIAAANQRIEATEARCGEALRNAEERVALSEGNLAFALEDVKCLKRKHTSDLSVFERRIQVVETASRALLDDYNRLRSEHLRVTAEDALEQEAEATEAIQRAADRLGGGAKHAPPARSGTEGGATVARRRSSTSTGDEQEQLRERQVFAFEVLANNAGSDSGAQTHHDLHTQVRAMLEALSARRDSAVQEETFERNIRPAQLPLLAAKEYENALICALFPMLETILSCVQADTELVRRAEAKKKQSSSSTSGHGRGAVEGTGSIQDYLAMVQGEVDAELLTMGLGDQREMTAWMKLRRYAQLEKQLRQCVLRLHRATNHVKLVPMETDPLPAAPTETIDGVVGSQTALARQRQEELQRTQELQQLMQDRFKQQLAQQQTQSLPKKPTSASRSGGSASPPPPQLGSSVGATTIDGAAAVEAAPPCTLSLIDPPSATPAPISDDGNTTVVHTLPPPPPAAFDIVQKEQQLAGPSAVATTTVYPRNAHGGNPNRRAPPSTQRRPAAAPDGWNSVRDEDILMDKPMSSHTPHDGKRPSSTGSPRVRRGTHGRWAGLPPKHMVLPSLRGASSHAAVATECTRVGPQASSDASLLSDEARAGVTRLPLRSEDGIETDKAFGNALSINKEYADLRGRLERSLAAKGLYTAAEPVATAVGGVGMHHGEGGSFVSTSSSGNNTTVPAWKRFKEERRAKGAS